MPRLTSPEQEPIIDLTSYLRKVAKTASAKLAQEEARRKQVEGSYEGECAQEESPLVHAESAEERARLHATLTSTLTPEESWLLHQHYYARKPLRQLGRELGLSHQAVHKRLDAVIEKLRLQLARNDRHTD